MSLEIHYYEMDKDTSDEDLMLRYATGDVAAFEALYVRHKGPVYRYMLNLCRNEAVAEELYQEVWMKLEKYAAPVLCQGPHSDGVRLASVAPKVQAYLQTAAHSRSPRSSAMELGSGAASRSWKSSSRPRAELTWRMVENWA